MISNTVLNWIYENYSHRLILWNERFVDGTVRQISRPGYNQRRVYNGHKRVQAVNFQAVVIPSGLVANLYGPVEGWRHDAGMLKESGLLNILQRRAVTPTRDILCIYGDPAYPLRPHLMGLYRDNPLTPQMRSFNKAMSEARVSVEWLFSDIGESFKFIDYKKNLKLGMSAVGKQYIISVLFRNILTRLYGNTTSNLFEVEPPSLLQYLA